MILLFQQYDSGSPYSGDLNDRFNYGTVYHGDIYQFDEVNRLVVHTTDTWDDYHDNNPPAYFSFSGAFFDGCNGTTHQTFYHDGQGGFTTQDEANSLSCGFVPADPPSCDLTMSYQLTASAGGANVTASSQASHGIVRYQLDGGQPQLSPTFNNLSPGRHVLAAIDTGVNNCVRSVAFTVATPPPPAAPAGPTQGIDFVRQPLWYPVTAPSGAEVVLELYAESRHQQEDFTLVFRARKRADASGRVGFRLDTLLLPLLRAMVPPLSQTATVVCRTPVLNYFVRTATVLGGGQPASFVTGALRTALRGGLPAERQDVDYFDYRRELFSQPPFLSWQPAGKNLTAEQPEWLFWLCDGQSVLTVRRSYVRTGFASSPAVVEEETVSLAGGRGSYGRLLAIPVRPQASTDSVSVGLYDALGEAVSSLVTYAMVPATPRSRYLHFSNSLGGFDTLRTEGRLEGALEATAERYELPALLMAGPAPAAERQAFDVTGSRKLKLATGWLTAVQLAWLQELVLAREIWEQQGARLLPIDPSKRQLAAVSDENPLRGMLLEFDYAYKVTAYANL